MAREEGRMKRTKALSWIGIGVLLAAAFVAGRYSLRAERDSPRTKAVFVCAPGAAEVTTTNITGPELGALVGATTELRWERTGHDICGGFGSNKRYSVAVCAFQVEGQCLPNNGFYNANVSPQDLGWEVDDPGVYTLSQEDIDNIRTKAAADSDEPLPDGTTVFFQIRYNYTNYNNVYGLWDVRPLTLGLDVNATSPSPAPPESPVLFPPQTYAPSGPFTLTWNEPDGAAYYRVRLVYRAGDPGGIATRGN